MHDASGKSGGSGGIFIVRRVQPIGGFEEGKSGDSRLPLNGNTVTLGERATGNLRLNFHDVFFNKLPSVPSCFYHDAVIDRVACDTHA